MYQSICIEGKKKLVSRTNHIPERYLGSHDLRKYVFYEERTTGNRFIIFLVKGAHKAMLTGLVPQNRKGAQGTT